MFQGALGLLEVLAITGGSIVALGSLIFFKDKAIRDEMIQKDLAVRNDMARHEAWQKDQVIEIRQECIRRDDLSREIEPLRANDNRILDKMERVEDKLTKFMEKVMSRLSD